MVKLEGGEGVLSCPGAHCRVGAGVAGPRCPCTALLLYQCCVSSGAWPIAIAGRGWSASRSCTVLTGPSLLVTQKSRLTLLPHQGQQEDSTKFILLTFLSVACIMGVLLASSLIYCLRHSSRDKLKEKLSGLGGDPGADATSAYQELCRQRMAPRPPDRPEGPHTSRINSVSSQFSDGPMPSPSARSSTSSWSEEPVQPDMDISTGHMILAYMEDHLKNKHRLEKEWDALCAYQAEPSSSLVAQREENLPKNRSLAVLTYDHSRILLKPENSHSNSDYINASPIHLWGAVQPLLCSYRSRLLPPHTHTVHKLSFEKSGCSRYSVCAERGL
ncbi:Hypothetical predicted protein [Marmota monax]|uniref:Tyrosine-protein phosphatase domain-containing protein n=1 Tax=Marmota monax TaxID=9995 RepID=A0A5E4C6M4_MARMO|nr:hypothetical protein GHT09_011518 [Marmota monax]VTJ77547.1 Hypothetical predicted protein [Marmota monax]